MFIQPTSAEKRPEFSPITEPPKQKWSLLEKSGLRGSTLAVYAVVIGFLSSLPVAAATCEQTQETCVKSCRGGDPLAGGACLVGCGLAYLACKMFLG